MKAWTSQNSQVMTVTSNPLPDWAITETEKTQYSALFAKLDQDLDGLVTGSEVRDFFLNSGLHQSVLAKIWDLVAMGGMAALNQ